MRVGSAAKTSVTQRLSLRQEKALQLSDECTLHLRLPFSSRHLSYSSIASAPTDASLKVAQHGRREN